MPPQLLAIAPELGIKEPLPEGRFMSFVLLDLISQADVCFLLSNFTCLAFFVLQRLIQRHRMWPLLKHRETSSKTQV